MKTAVRVATVVFTISVAVMAGWLAPPQPDEGFPFTTISGCPGGAAPCLDVHVSVDEVATWLEGQR